MTITEFLLARIAEDEAQAYDAIDERTRVTPEEGPDMGLQSWPDVGVPAVLVGPERVLAECKAKGVILAMYDVYAREAGQRSGVMKMVPEIGRDVLSDAIHLMAAIYADHPDYQQDWVKTSQDTPENT